MIFEIKKKRLSKSEKTKRREKTVSFIVLFLVCVIWLIPILYMIGASFKSDLDLQMHPESIFPSSPSEWTLKHYSGFLIRDGKVDNMPLWMLNSLWSALATVAITVILDLLTAYGVVFLNFKGKKLFMKFLLLWMAVPGVIGTAPSFTIYAMIRNSLNITGPVESYLYIYMWIVLPGASGIFNMLLMRNFLLLFRRILWKAQKATVQAI